MIRIKSIEFLNDYKLFKKGQLIVFSDKSALPDQENSLTLFTGRNGTGKTTILSIVARMFHHLERYRGKLEAEFKFTYVIKHGNQFKEVTIKHCNNLVNVNVPGYYHDLVLIPFKGAEIYDSKLANEYNPEQIVYYTDFHNFCPKSIVTSAFSVHGEYPSKRARNFIGYAIVENYNLDYIYGKNHFGLQNLSRGIKRFIKKYQNDIDSFNEVFKLFDLEFTGRVQEHYWGSESKWVKPTKKWLDQIEGDLADGKYLNDIEFTRNNRLITFRNMSAGEKMLLLRFITILDGIEEDSIVIIEEPEIHLDQIWCKQIISLLQLLYKGYGAHFLIATHNLDLINTVNKESLVRLDGTVNTVVNDNTFLSNNEGLISTLYGYTDQLNSVEKEVLAIISNKSTSLQELKNLETVMGESIYKYLVYKRIKELENVADK